MDEAPLSDKDAALLRYLKGLVTALSVTMIVGFIVLVSVIVMRFNAEGTAPLPAEITLPGGTKASAVTRGRDWIGIVTDDDRILIFDRDTGTLRQDIAIE